LFGKLIRNSRVGKYSPGPESRLPPGRCPQLGISGLHHDTRHATADLDCPRKAPIREPSSAPENSSRRPLQVPEKINSVMNKIRRQSKTKFFVTAQVLILSLDFGIS
jgi:hypothetical protein